MADYVAGLIDVFADSPLRGNPLAVVEAADDLDEDVMRRVAREFNQSETTFLLKSTSADWKLRSFTASGAEVFGAGHNALGAWLWLAHYGHLGEIRGEARVFRQEIGHEILPVSLVMRDGRIHGQLGQAALRLSPSLERLEPLAEALGLEVGDFLVKPAPRAADTGASHLLVRIVDRAAVDRAQPSAEKLIPVLAAAGAEGCYLYAFDENVPDFAYTRFFNPAMGLWEDPATGTAAGPLCAYLGQEGLLGEAGELTVEQGTRMGRQSILRVRLVPDAELMGSGTVVFRGKLLI